MPPASFAVRITRPYSDLSGMFHVWSLQCEKLLVYQHTGSQTELVHCHALIVNLRVTKERLKQLSVVPGRPLNGNQDWSFKTAKETTDKYVTYMSKGQYDPLYVMGFELDYLNRMKAEWKERSKLPHKNAKLHQDFRNHVYTQWNHDTGYLYPEAPPEVYELYGVHFDNDKYRFDKLRKFSYNYSISLKGEFNVQTMNLAKSLLLTFCYENEVKVDLKAVFKF